MDRALPSACHEPTPSPSYLSPFAAFWTALTVARERRRLATLDDHILRDIGVDRDAALREAARPVWDVPRGWMR